MSTRAKKNPVSDKPRRPRGQGGVTQRPDGLWVGFIELPKDPLTGKRRRKQVTHKTYEGCVEKLDAARADLKQVGDLHTSEPTFEEWVAYWFKNIGERDLAPSSLIAYRKYARYATSVWGKKKLSALKVADVRNFHDSMLQSRGLSSTTANTAHNVVSKMLKDAIREEYLTRNVCTLVSAPPVENPDADALSTDEALAVLESIQNDRNASRWAFALLTGARQGECLGLKWDQVDFDNNILYFEWQLQRLNWFHGCGTEHQEFDVVGVRPDGKPRRAKRVAECGKKNAVHCPQRHLPQSPKWEHQYLGGNWWLARPKTKSSRRAIPLVPALRTLLEEHREQTKNDPNPDGWVWTANPKWIGGRRLGELNGEPVDPSMDREQWRDILKRAGVRHVRVHDLRHTAITLLYELGVAEVFIQQIVGQKSIKVTRGYRKLDVKSKVVRDALTGLGSTLEVLKPREVLRLPDPQLTQALEALETPRDEAA
jgi:integrase